MSMLASLRQFKYPKEFRIAAPEWPDFSKALEDMAAWLEPALSEIETGSRKEEGLVNLVVDIGTVIWRLRRRLTTESEVPEEIRRISRDLESAEDALKQGGIEIKDHTGEKYDGGMALHVIAFQPTAEVSQEQVIETVKPTMYHKDKLVRMGEVIVGVPAENTAPTTPEQR